MKPRGYDKYGNRVYAGRGIIHTVDTEEKAKSGRWGFCNEDPRLVNKCLTCPSTKCNGDCAEFRAYRKQLKNEKKGGALC